MAGDLTGRRPAPDAAAGDGCTLCPLCGHGFEPADTLCHHGCPFAGHCGAVRCPACGYEFAETRRGLVDWLAGLFARGGPGAGDACEVADLAAAAPGSRQEVVAVAAPAGSASRSRDTLAVFGLVPGARVEVLRRRPAVVVRVGETELALDPDVARRVAVRPPGATPRVVPRP